MFTEMDADGSGYLDEDEVMKAVAMLGFAVDKANLVRNGQTQDKTRQDKHKTGNKHKTPFAYAKTVQSVGFAARQTQDRQANAENIVGWVCRARAGCDHGRDGPRWQRRGHPR